jgi:hypothetical protein
MIGILTFFRKAVDTLLLEDNFMVDQVHLFEPAFDSFPGPENVHQQVTVIQRFYNVYGF